MKKKGSITVFLALVLSVLLSLVGWILDCILCSGSMTVHFLRIMICFFWTGRRVELSWIWQLSMTIWNPI